MTFKSESKETIEAVTAPILDIAIVGGGIAGLSAAYELSKHGIQFRVFEAGDRPGGVILTERFDDWIIDAGPDAILRQKPAALKLCQELGIAERLQTTLPPRTSYILRDKQLHPLAEGSFLGFPLRLGALARSSLFTLPGKVRMALEPLLAKRDTDNDETIAAFVQRRFGNEAVRYLAEPLLAGIHAGDVDRLSVRALFPRLVEAENHFGSVLKAFRTLQTPTSSKGAFVSLPGGIGELVEHLVNALPPQTLALSTRITDMQRTGTFLLKTSNGPIRARAVVLAVPAYVAAGLLRGIDTTLSSLCNKITYASTATVAFGYHKRQIDHPLNGTGFVVPRVEPNPLLAATWVSSKWPNRAPEGCVLLRGFLGGGRDQNCLEHSDDTLIEMARNGLSQVLHISGPPLFTRLYRWTQKSPQYEVGHHNRIVDIQQQLTNVPGIFLAGSGFQAIGIPDCIDDGRATAVQAAKFTNSQID